MQRVLLVSVGLHALTLAALLALRLPAPAEPDEPARIEVVFGDSGAVPPARAAALAPAQPAAAVGDATRSPDAAEGQPVAEAVAATAAVEAARSPAPQPGLRVDEPDPLMIPARDVLGNNAPDYPDAARRLRQQGTVLLRLHIGIDGGVTRIETLQSSGIPLLDDAARSALAQWHFLPAERERQPVPSYRDQPVRFVLE